MSKRYESTRGLKAPDVRELQLEDMRINTPQQVQMMPSRQRLQALPVWHDVNIYFDSMYRDPKSQMENGLLAFNLANHMDFRCISDINQVTLCPFYMPSAFVIAQDLNLRSVYKSTNRIFLQFEGCTSVTQGVLSSNRKRFMFECEISDGPIDTIVKVTPVSPTIYLHGIIAEIYVLEIRFSMAPLFTPIAFAPDVVDIVHVTNDATTITFSITTPNYVGSVMPLSSNTTSASLMVDTIINFTNISQGDVITPAIATSMQRKEGWMVATIDPETGLFTVACPLLADLTPEHFIGKMIILKNRIALSMRFTSGHTLSGGADRRDNTRLGTGF